MPDSICIPSHSCHDIPDTSSIKENEIHFLQFDIEIFSNLK
ncbi:Uncharacterised protein [Mycobacteroides abscessus subsp. abscessus]|nr:Uncharacterised protein [Mycobacteroides abscessus subsp. abscessus]